MIAGWTIKDAGAVLGVHPNKVSQAVKPAAEKICKLMLADPYRTWAMLYETMDRLSTMSHDEWETRWKIQTGRADRLDVLPTARR